MREKVNWNRYSMKFLASRSATGTNFELLKSFAQGTVLDAGCGNGVRLARLALQKAVGVDVGIPGLQYGKRNFPHLTFIAASVYNLPFEDNKFDFVYSVDVLEHLEHAYSALREYYRVCKPGAFVLMQTPNYPIKRLYDLWHCIRGSRNGFRDDPTHVTKFNCSRLISVVTRAGFDIDFVSARNVFFEKYFPVLLSLRNKAIGRTFGQKIIVVAKKVD